MHLARSVNETPEEMHNEKQDVERLRGRRCDADVAAGLKASAQQKSEVTLSRQPGIFYMPSHIMEKNKLIEARGFSRRSRPTNGSI